MKVKVGTILTLLDGTGPVYVVHKRDHTGVYFTDNLGTIGVVGINAVHLHFNIKNP